MLQQSTTQDALGKLLMPSCLMIRTSLLQHFAPCIIDAAAGRQVEQGKNTSG